MRDATQAYVAAYPLSPYDLNRDTRTTRHLSDTDINGAKARLLAAAARFVRRCRNESLLSAADEDRLQQWLPTSVFDR